MAKFKVGDLREKALPRVIIDWETGDTLFDADSPGHVQGTVALDDGWTVAGIEDTAANDSSKQWEVPAGQEWSTPARATPGTGSSRSASRGPGPGSRR